MNLALLGARASGKTSLLNMIDLKARERHFCVARVDLNEGDVETQVGFFYKFFDSVFSAACDYVKSAPHSGSPFGGKKGKTYDAYLDMVTAYQVPADKEWCPFLFPVQYAKAMSAGVLNARVSDPSLRHDLNLLRVEVDAPIAILVDECNVLARQRVLLEVLRNLFMNTPGYMLVFTGTPDLFPVMDEVFSPIVRQFKKITVGAFEEPREVEECIRKPLEAIGLSLQEVVDPETLVDLTRRRDVTGGRPYEIQLLCHFMFRRMQRGRAPSMELDIDVLDDVLTELQQAQDLAQRRVVRAVRLLTSRQLEALHVLGWSTGLLRFEELWFVEYVPFGAARWTKEELATQLRSLQDLGILEVRDQCVVFAGDELERLYCKYFARRSASLPLELSRFQPETGCAVGVSSALLDAGLSLIGPPLEPASISSTDETPLATLATRLADPGSLSDADIRGLRFLAAYRVLLDVKDENRDGADLLEIAIRTPWMNAGILLATTPRAPFSRARAESLLAGMGARATELGAHLTAAWGHIDPTPADVIATRIAACAGGRTRFSFAEEHLSRMFDAYVERGDREGAVFHARCALAFGRSTPPPGRNNAAYVLLHADPLLAESALQSVIADYESKAERALPAYNLAVIEAERGDLVGALAHFDQALTLASEQTDPGRNACLFLYVPRLEGGALRFEETRDVDLLAAATEATRILGALRQPS